MIEIVVRYESAQGSWITTREFCRFKMFAAIFLGDLRGYRHRPAAERARRRDRGVTSWLLPVWAGWVDRRLGIKPA